MAFFRRKVEPKFRSTDILGVNSPSSPPPSNLTSTPTTPAPLTQLAILSPRTPTSPTSSTRLPTVSELTTLARTRILRNPDSAYWWSLNGRRICESWLSWWTSTYPDGTTTGGEGGGKGWEEVFRKDMENKEAKSANQIGFLSGLKKRLDEDVKKRGKKKRKVGEMVVRGPRRE